MNGEDLKKIRVELGLNQTEFGKKLGFSRKGAQRSIHALESGEREIKPTVAKLAKFIKEEATAAPAGS